MMVDWLNAYKMEVRVANICFEMENNGVLLDQELAAHLITELTEMRSTIKGEVIKHLPKRVKSPYKDSYVKKPFKADGSYSKGVLDWLFRSCSNSYEAIDYEYKRLIGGPFSRVLFEEVNLGSPEQLKDTLLSLGWKPTEWNYKKDKEGRAVYEGKEKVKTSPKLTEDSYDTLTSGIGPSIAKYLKASHRLSLVRGIYESVDRQTGLVHANMNTLATPTARMRHKKPIVNIPKADPSVFYGKEMRSLFVARTGRVMVGWDASGLEARVFGHFLNDEALIHELINGDFHTLLWDVVTEEFVSSRSIMKNVEYAYLYGAQDPKLGQTADRRPNGMSAKQVGAEIRKRIETKIPAIGDLVTKVKSQAKKGWLPGIDGRKIFVRSEHSALNSLFQSTGSIAVKTAVCILDDKVKENRWDVLPWVVYHDEVQADSHPDCAELYGEAAVQSVRQAGEVLKLNIALDAEYKVGLNWASTH